MPDIGYIRHAIMCADCFYHEDLHTDHKHRSFEALREWFCLCGDPAFYTSKPCSLHPLIETQIEDENVESVEEKVNTSTTATEIEEEKPFLPTEKDKGEWKMEKGKWTKIQRSNKEKEQNNIEREDLIGGEKEEIMQIEETMSMSSSACGYKHDSKAACICLCCVTFSEEG